MLNKIKMPSKSAPELEGMEDEMEDMEGAEQQAPADPAMMEAISDEDLLAEIKKRGLMSQLQGESMGEMDSEEEVQE